MKEKERHPDALAVVIPEAAPKPKRPAARKPADPREAEILAGVRSGKRFYNYYESKVDGTLYQKVPVFLAADEVMTLKLAALAERRTLSDLVREAVDDYLKKTGRR